MPSAATTRRSLEGLFAGPQDLVERLPMLRNILQKTAGYWAENIRNISATVPEVVLVGVESGPPATMIGTTANLGVACVLEAPKWNARMIVCAEYEFAFTVVEMLLGGDGSELGQMPDRPLTSIELGLVQLVFEQFGNALEQAFEPVAPTNFTAGPAAARVGIDVLGRLTVPVVAAKFHLFAMGLGGAVTLLMSQSVLSPMRNELSRTASPESVRPDPAWSQKIQTEVSRANVDLVAVLDEQELTLLDIARLSVGHVLPLGASPDGLLRVECNGEALINCEVGKANGSYALRVRDFIDKQREFMEEILAS
jgi:flagellar motor switch protein FliM